MTYKSLIVKMANSLVREYGLEASYNQAVAISKKNLPMAPINADVALVIKSRMDSECKKRIITK